MANIPARVGYTAPAAPSDYQKNWLSTQLRNIARALLPQITRQVLAHTTVLATDDTLVCDATGGAITVTLPLPDQVKFLKVSVVRINGGGNAVTLSGTVSGSVNPSLASQWASITIQSDGTRWIKLAEI